MKAVEDGYWSRRITTAEELKAHIRECKERVREAEKPGGPLDWLCWTLFGFHVTTDTP